MTEGIDDRELETVRLVTTYPGGVVDVLEGPRNAIEKLLEARRADPNVEAVRLEEL